MRKINKVYNDIRVAEAADFCQSLIRELNEAAIEDVHLAALKAEVQPLGNHLVGAINRDKAESDLDNYDALRDNVYRSLLHLTKGYLHHPDAQISASAVEVDAVVQKYGFELVNENYSAQSALLDSFLEDMAKPELAPKVELLPGVKDLKVKLEGEQLKFKTAEKAWLDARSENRTAESATEIKKELIKAVNEKLVVYLRAMAQVNPTPYEALIAKVILLIDSANAIVRRRRNGAEPIEASNN